MIPWPSIFLSHVLACMGRDSISVTRLRNPWDVGKSNEYEIAIAYIYHHKTNKSQPKYQNTDWNCWDQNLINGFRWMFEPNPIFLIFRCRLVWKMRKVHENKNQIHLDRRRPRNLAQFYNYNLQGPFSIQGLTSKNDLEPKSYIKKGLDSTLASDIRAQI